MRDLIPVFSGDIHFGSKVEFENENQIKKPREIFWEWLLLDSSSELRKFLSKLSMIKLGFDIYSTIVPLEYKPFSKSFSEGGFVNRVKTYPDFNFDNFEYQKFGAVLALMTFFGINDLHKENFLIGKSQQGNTIFMPIDIEVLFEKASLISSHLLDEKGSHNFECTLSCLDQLNINQISSMIYGFIKTMFFLFENLNIKRFPIVKVKSQIDNSRIRVVLRDSSLYQNILEEHQSKNNLDLFEEEFIQIKKGWIPYFFRRHRSQKLFYLNENRCEIPVQSFDYSKYFNIHFRNYLLSNSFELIESIKSNSIAIARYFGHSIQGIAHCHELSLFFGDRSIGIQFGKMKFKCSR